MIKKNFKASPLKMMKNTFYSTYKLFSLQRFSNFWLDIFSHVRKQLDKKAKVNFKIHDVTIWKANSNNAHIVEHHKK